MSLQLIRLCLPALLTCSLAAARSPFPGQPGPGAGPHATRTSSPPQDVAATQTPAELPTAPASETEQQEEPQSAPFRLETRPTMRLAVGTLDSYREASQRARITNDASTPLSWTARGEALWLQVRPSSGELAPGESAELSLSTDYIGAEAAGPGHHAASLVVEGSWLDEQEIEQSWTESRRLDLLIRSSSPVGINLPWVADFSSSLPFRNLFLQASSWIPQEADGDTWNTGEALDLDDRGWVRSLATGGAAGALMARGIDGKYPGGSYVLTYEGQGVLETYHDARITGASPGRLELTVEPSDAGIHLKLVDTSPEDPLRNIKLTPEAWEEDLLRRTFHPDFLRNLRPFSVLRFAAWQRINDSPVERWQQRTRPFDAVQTGPGGVALELMLRLCNELHVEPWFCIPHRADDDYVRRFAQLVRDLLDDDLRVWVEYTSEPWNPAFQQHLDLATSGIEEGRAEEPFAAALLTYAQRAKEVFRTWNRVFKDDPERVLCVISGQTENLAVGQLLLANVGEAADVYAIAPWFGMELGSPEAMEVVSSMSSEQVLDAVASDAAQVLGEVESHAQLARRAGVLLAAYEGGQHLVGEFGAEENEQLTALFHSANRDPRMGLVYSEFLAGWRDAGGTLFCPYQLVDRPTRWGSWGLLEYQDQPASDAPKYGAVTEFALDNPLWWEAPAEEEETGEQAEEGSR